jgi:hypothetical protein
MAPFLYSLALSRTNIAPALPAHISPLCITFPSISNPLATCLPPQAQSATSRSLSARVSILISCSASHNTDHRPKHSCFRHCHRCHSHSLRLLPYLPLDWLRSLHSRRWHSLHPFLESQHSQIRLRPACLWYRLGPVPASASHGGAGVCEAGRYGVHYGDFAL